MIWRQRNGMKWRSIPSELGPWGQAAQLHIRWSRTGVWQRAFERLRDSGRPDLGEVFLDGTSVRAHQKAAGAKRRAVRHAFGRSRGGWGTKACAVCDGLGRPLAFALIPGQAAELTAAPWLLDAVLELGRSGRVVCERGTSAQAWRAAIRAAGAEPVVPGQPTHKNAPPHDRATYRRRLGVVV